MKKKIFIGIGLSVILIILLAVIFADGDSDQSSTSQGNDVEILSTNEIVSQTGGRTIHTEVKNNADKLIKGITLKSIYYDKNGTIVGTGSGSCFNIPSHQVRVVDILATDIYNAATYKVEIELCVFD